MAPDDSYEALIKKHALALPEAHKQKQLTLASTGRHILVSYPENLTDDELMDFLGYLTHEFRRQLPLSPPRLLRRPRGI